MDFLIHRYRNLTVLVLVIGAQLLLLAYQVKTREDVPLIRVWAVTAVTPVAKALEVVRRNTIGFVEDYLVLVRVREQNKTLSQENGTLKLENQFLKAELATAERFRALSNFQARTPSKTVAARVIGTGTAADAKVVFVDRGTLSGVQRGMAVVTPDGIVGKVVSSYPTAAQVLLITDTSFAAGVISQKNRVYGTLRGQGHTKCRIDYVQNGETVDLGEKFFTSGDDRVFPKGLPVGEVKVVQQGRDFKEITLVPYGLQAGLEEVLVVVEGVHQSLPDAADASPELSMLAPPPADAAAAASAELAKQAAQTTDADLLLEKYRKVGEAQKHAYGTPGAPTPNFNLKVTPPAPAVPAAGAGAAGVAPAPAPTPANPRPAQPKVVAPKAVASAPPSGGVSIAPPKPSSAGSAAGQRRVAEGGAARPATAVRLPAPVPVRQVGLETPVPSVRRSTAPPAVTEGVRREAPASAGTPPGQPSVPRQPAPGNRPEGASRPASPND